MKSVWRTRFLVAAFAIIGQMVSTGIAQATVISVGTNFDIEVSTPIEVGITPLWAVTLTAVGKNGALPNTFDSDKSGAGGTGITTVGDLLHQVWEYGTIATPTLTLLGDPTPISQEVDTHFLVETADIATMSPPAENKPTPYTVEDSRGGFGNSLTGTFSLLAVEQPRWDFAYFVVPAGTEVFFDFEIGANGFDSETVGGSFVVPEPSTLLLLVLGALGLLYRRGVR